jgi:ParB family chromosome partitioning protein
MAKAVQKITLSPSRDIPFGKLVLSQSNVRSIKEGVSIDELARSISRFGLIQSLHVRPVLDAEGKDTGIFEVPAGGRRYRALQQLVKQKYLSKTSLVPCVVGDADSAVLVDEVSLAENIERAPLHPLDQFRAFQKMREKGRSEEDIAAAYSISVNVVKQRLRLASVSPKLLEVYGEDDMSLEQLIAFTISEDHARQEQVWDTVRQSFNNEPYIIRRMLTEKTVGADDKRVMFVGIDAYEAAGGVVLRDLFQSDHNGWLQDVTLLDRLTIEKLKFAADEVAAEGWKWIEVAVNLPYGATQGLRRLDGTRIELTHEEQASRDALQEEFDRLTGQYDSADELPDEVDQRLDELEEALDELAKRPVRFEPAEIAKAGVFVGIDSDGCLSIQRGYVRPEDELPVEVDGPRTDDAGETGDPSVSPAVQRTVVTVGGEPAVAKIEDEEDDGIKPLPDRLVSELSAHRTLALREAVANNPNVAMTALLHKLVSDTFRHYAAGALEASVRHISFPSQSVDLKDSDVAKSIEERHENWAKSLPTEDEALWQWLTVLGEDDRMKLLAHCVSYGVNALHEKPNPYGAGVTEHTLKVRLSQADRLARVTGLDMVHAGWRPTVSNYLGRVTKSRILEAVRDGAGARAAQLIEHMKKGDMAREAERLLADKGWLPEPLRLANAEMTTADQDSADALPAFLSEDGDDEEADDDHASEFMIAAE